MGLNVKTYCVMDIFELVLILIRQELDLFAFAGCVTLERKQ
jgi:hypothetical protein